MLAAVLIIAFLAAVTLPSFWAQSILKKYAAPRPDFPGTGGEFARHLLDGLGLQNVKTEPTAAGDHYDPEAKAVRLSQDHFTGKSLAAVVVAAHEVGHAHQDKHAYGPLRSRTALVKSTAWIQRVGPAVIMLSPVLVAVLKTPTAALLGLGAGLAVMGVGVLVHLVTLPTEFDASFNRALPILKKGGYLGPDDLPAARRILTACALTYVAGALMQLINIARWLRVLKF
ncbi:MAG: zinc metallopeptidase [Pseudomonadota bacterium]